MATDDDSNTQENRGHRAKLKRCIDSNTTLICVVILVLIDCGMIVTELIIELQCQEVEDYNQDASTALHIISRVILGIFIVEILLRLYAHGLEFFCLWLDVCDAIVIIISFILDVVEPLPETWATSVNFIILFRLWRIIAIIYAIIATATSHTQYRLEKETEAREEAEQELLKFREYCDDLEVRNVQLRELLRRKRIQDPAMTISLGKKPKPRYVFVSVEAQPEEREEQKRIPKMQSLKR